MFNCFINLVSLVFILDVLVLFREVLLVVSVGGDFGVVGVGVS